MLKQPSVSYFAVLFAFALTNERVHGQSVESWRKREVTPRPVAPDNSSLIEAERKRLLAEGERIKKRGIGILVEKDAIDNERAAINRLENPRGFAKETSVPLSRKLRLASREEGFGLEKRRWLDDVRDWQARQKRLAK